MPRDSRNRPPWDYPDCPRCESEVFVDGHAAGSETNCCHLCQTKFTPPA